MRMIFFYVNLIQSIGPTHSQLARFARARFALCATENFRKKKCVSIDLKCSETHKNAKKKITPLTDYALRAKRIARVAKRKLTYPMSPAGSQGVSMPSFMPIGLKLWALEGYRQTNRQSYFNYIDVCLSFFPVIVCLSICVSSFFNVYLSACLSLFVYV